ncbi:hypothetical protein AVEN_97261-1 [Araneus ventricosus]|uniref:Uncharacterized protein n=1 Tax=Araneus ventricosus TaxID=182803 RepID=A0A4Y1ZM94_ARAVE|nr:hypothetical protein AVEN_97261-1 [Araneus ventricosus]
MAAARVLFQHVAKTKPDVYEQILNVIRPHSLENVIHFLQEHLEHSVPDLNIFNQHPHRIPDFCLQFVLAIRKRFPTAGDAFGIHLTCRVTKSNTQSTLDSKHMKTLADTDQNYQL